MSQTRGHHAFRSLLKRGDAPSHKRSLGWKSRRERPLLPKRTAISHAASANMASRSCPTRPHLQTVLASRQPHLKTQTPTPRTWQEALNLLPSFFNPVNGGFSTVGPSLPESIRCDARRFCPSPSLKEPPTPLLSIGGTVDACWGPSGIIPLRAGRTDIDAGGRGRWGSRGTVLPRQLDFLDAGFLKWIVWCLSWVGVDWCTNSRLHLHEDFLAFFRP